MHISVTLLYGDGKRLSTYAVKTQIPVIGWLHYDVTSQSPNQPQKVEARLLSDEGAVLLSLDHAALVASRGTQGALLRGVVYRKKGAKHSVKDLQAWWCEAPPRNRPLLDKELRLQAAEQQYEARKRAGWGNV